MVWCPASNLFMFNVTCKVRKLLEEGVNVAIGTDSTHTGSVNLLEEMRLARGTYRRLYGEDLPARRIAEMVTANPARAFRLQESTGSIAAGKLADLLVLRPRVADPYEALLQGEQPSPSPAEARPADGAAPAPSVRPPPPKVPTCRFPVAPSSAMQVTCRRCRGRRSPTTSPSEVATSTTFSSLATVVITLVIRGSTARAMRSICCSRSILRWMGTSVGGTRTG